MQIEDVLRNSPPEKQMMLFSATMPRQIRSVVNRYMKDPQEIDITENQAGLGSKAVEHKVMILHKFHIHRWKEFRLDLSSFSLVEKEKSTHLESICDLSRFVVM